MSRLPKSFLLSNEIHEYLVEHGTSLGEIERDLIEETSSLGPIAGMQIAPEQGALLTLLARAIGVRDAIEIGTFTGYSALCLARGLSDGGRLLCCDISEEWTAIARRYWARAGVEDRIDLRIGPAAETLRSLPTEERFDLGFIDADKPRYSVYYEEILSRLRPGGLILVDNVLWQGRVVDPEENGDSTRAIREFNVLVRGDERVDRVMLPVSDGLTIVRKRGPS
jgi:caffeoyl-CoA O-methyltransferase